MHVLLIIVASLFLGSACSKKDKNAHEAYAAPLFSEGDALPAMSRLPTRPEGGLVPGKVEPMDPEESARRKARNEILPIQFGSSAAGINMQTSQREAHQILAAPLGSAQGFEFFPEHIRILWNDNEQGTPRLLVVDEGYAGKLELPAPFGKLAVGQSLSALLKNEAGIKAFMLAAGASFEQMTGKAYNCEESFTCRMLSSEDSYELQFKRGGILLSRDPSMKLQVIYFQEAQKFFPRVTGSIVYGTAVGPLNFSTSRSSFESKYGQAEQVANGFSYYDQGSVRIAWSPSSLPLIIGALRTFAGTMDFGATLGIHKIGDSFTGFEADNGQLLMLALDRHFEARTPDFDCSVQVPALCSMENDGDLLVIELPKGIFVFTAGSDKRWLLFQMSAN